MVPPSYKYCLVPECKNSTLCTPQKKFFSVSMSKKDNCCTSMGIKKKILYKTTQHCCEDHHSDLQLTSGGCISQINNQEQKEHKNPEFVDLGSKIEWKFEWEVKTDVLMQCCTCLSVGRKLKPLGVYLDIYRMLISSDANQDETQICWECHALLNNAAKFRRRVQKAHEILQSRQNYVSTSLSNLTMTVTLNDDRSTEFDILQSVEDTKIINHNEDDGITDDTCPILEDVHDQVDNIQKLDNSKTSKRYENKAQNEKNVSAEVKVKASMQGKEAKRNNNNWAKKRALQNRMPKFRIHNTLAQGQNRCKNKVFECLKCGLMFGRRRDFYQHFKEWHEKFICDHCGKSFKMKYCIINHIRKQHSPVVCGVCGKRFARYNGLWLHKKVHHSTPTASAYCAECDKPYRDVYRYRWHRANSAKHSPKQKLRIPCPGCNKVFSKNIYMKDHYDVVHLKKYKYTCGECDKHFLRNADLTKHKQRVHEGILPPKDKICDVCGKAFTTNKILNNHLRTHTGERPFTCSRCPARFAQDSALASHIKSIHSKD